MTDMTDRAMARMKFTKMVAPKKPFFMYFAPGAMHAPHDVTAKWREQFKGKFDMGWDKYREFDFANPKRMASCRRTPSCSRAPD